MYKRILVRPHKSFFLLGPRGTGKSTFLRTQTFALKLDLLSSKTRLELERNPSHLTDLCRVLQKNAWVLIDEVQKIPELLDEVHFLIEEHGLNFALSGSSARKLKRADANLLAGRALNCKMFSLVYPEYGEAIPLADRLEWGTLPLVVDQKDLRADTLETYVDNYLRQELVEEGIVRSLAPFSRFLQIAATMNGQILNVENIARESKVGRTTVDSYFSVLVDTLIGFRLPAYQSGVKNREVSHPKFYFFDFGVARAAAGLTREHLDRMHLGVSFETLLLNEISAFISYRKKGYQLFYHAVSGGGDIDLVIQLSRKTVSKSDRLLLMEFKLSRSWDRRWSKELEEFSEKKGKSNIEQIIGVYTGDHRLKVGEVDVYPVDLFLQDLYDGKII